MAALPTDPVSRASWLTTTLGAAITTRPLLARAKIAYAIVDLSTGIAVATREADQGMNLASTTKVLTSVAALHGLGGGFRWRTAVYATVPVDAEGVVAGDLYVRGRGDPTLTDADLGQLAADVAAKGIRSVEGALVVDATYFDGVTEPPHFSEQPKETAAFRAPVSAFAVDRSAITVTVVGDPGGGARVTIAPDTEGVRITKRAVTSIATGRTHLRLDLKPKPDHLELELSGEIRVGDGSYDLRKRVEDPTRLAADVFRAALAREGVKLRDRKLVLAKLPLAARIVAVHDSAPLVDVLRLMNKHSDNNIAEQLLKTIGAEAAGPTGAGSWPEALAAEHALLAELGLAGPYKLENGSGLFGSTAVSPSQLVAVLVAAHRDYRIGPDLVASLPVAGFDGTLARRMCGTPAEGRIRAKTGTLNTVITLAGYAGVTTGHVLAFALFVNDIPAGQRPLVRAMLDDMAEAMVAYAAP